MERKIQWDSTMDRPTALQDSKNWSLVRDGHSPSPSNLLGVATPQGTDHHHTVVRPPRAHAPLTRGPIRTPRREPWQPRERTGKRGQNRMDSCGFSFGLGQDHHHILRLSRRLPRPLPLASPVVSV